MAIRAWTDGDLRLAMRLLQWAQPEHNQPPNTKPATITHPKKDDEQNWGLRTA
jgi:hypothetical protein